MSTARYLSIFASQVSSTGAANPSAISDVANTSTGAIDFPVGTTAQRNATPVNGMSRLNSTTGAVEVYYNSTWNTIYTFPAPIVGTQKAIFGYGYNDIGAVITSVTNKVSNTGVVAANTAGVGTARTALAAAGYGTDKAIFGYGSTINSAGGSVSVTNLVSNTGTVASDTTGVGTARYRLAAAGYGTDKGIFGFGFTISSTFTAITNKVSNTGVVATDTAGVGSTNFDQAAASYGTDKAIFGYGALANVTNLVSNTGVVATDTAGVGTTASGRAAAGYGGDKAIFGYGSGFTSITNLVSNTGVVANNTTGVGTARSDLAAAGYGGDKAIFGYGRDSNSSLTITNLVSNTGVVASNVTSVGTSRYGLAAAGYSIT